MTTQSSPAPQADRPQLHRSREERVLFGVCGGIAECVGIDPTIVRVAFVVVALIPPVSVLSIIGYPILAIVMPSEDVAHLPGRDRVRSNIAAIRDDAGDLTGEVRNAVASIMKRREPAAGAPAPATPATPAPTTTAAGTNGAVRPTPAETPGDVEAATAAGAPR